MHPKQLALLDAALDAIAAECLRSPVATLNAGHLKAVLLEQLLRAGAAVFERGATAAEGKLLRLAGEVIRSERHVLPETLLRRGARPARAPDLRVLDPVAFNVDVHARSALSAPDRTAAGALLERFDALAAGATHVLVLACDRRAYDGLRVERPGADARPTELSRVCASLLPPSAALQGEREPGEAVLNGRPYAHAAVVTPMVFGMQRVVAAVWPRRTSVVEHAPAPQLDAFVA